MQCGGGESIYFKSIHVKAQLNLDMADFNFDKNTEFYISQLFQHSYDIFVLEVHTFLSSHYLYRARTFEIVFTIRCVIDTLIPIVDINM